MNSKTIMPEGDESSYHTHDEEGNIVLYGYKKNKHGHYGYYIHSNGLERGRYRPVIGKSVLHQVALRGIKIKEDHIRNIEQNLPI